MSRKLDLPFVVIVRSFAGWAVAMLRCTTTGIWPGSLSKSRALAQRYCNARWASGGSFGGLRTTKPKPALAPPQPLIEQRHGPGKVGALVIEKSAQHREI